MKTFEVQLDSFCEEIFHEMERVQDGKHCHTVEFAEVDKETCAFKIAERLVPFIEKQLEEADEARQNVI